jgi:hypothetical protein
MCMDEIVVKNSGLVGRRLTTLVEVPRGLRKYFKSFRFFAEYDADIVADRSILNIPMVATILPFAWLTGVDVYVEALDQTFKASMDQLQQVFQTYYPKISFKTHITVDRLVENEIEVGDPLERTALLFSGGVDSTHSLVTHLHLKPRLIMLWGIDGYPYPENAVQWETIIATYSQFAQRLGLPYHVVKTNDSVILDERRISHDFHQFIYDAQFRMVLQHTFLLLPLAAPLSMGRFDRFLLSGDRPPETDDNLRGSRILRAHSATQPITDEKFVWATLTVNHIGEMRRKDKIVGAITDYLQNDDLTLKVCLRKLERPQLNDNACAKCLTTITYLILAGIDPNQCGFQVSEATWTRFKEYLEHDLKQETVGTVPGFRKMQKSLPDHVEQDFYGFNAFLDWFSNFDLQYKEKNVWFYRDLYHALPYPIAKILDRLYSMRGIRIHDQRPLPRKEASSPTEG